MSLRHGARQLLDQLEANERLALEALLEAKDKVRSNPDYVLKKIELASALIREAGLLRRDKLPPQLQKAAPALEQRVDDLEERLERLEIADRLAPWRKAE